jgi:hypothetical protein
MVTQISKKKMNNLDSQIIGNYLIGETMSKWLAKELSLIDFRIATKELSPDRAYILRVIAFYEDFKNKGGNYADFKNNLL